MSIDELRLRLGGVELANPVMLASGVQGQSLSRVVEALRLGAGAAITKSVGLEPRLGYPEPTMAEADSGMVNAAGLPNPGAGAFSQELALLRGKGLPVFVSAYGSDAEEFAAVVKHLDQNEFAGYELNLSCPHVEGVGTEVGTDPELVSLIVKAVKSSTHKPVFVKLSPNAERLVEVAIAVADAGADGVTAVNTVKALAIDVRTGRPSLSNSYGGLSGGAIRPIALRCVYELSESVDIPIIGCGGISSWEHAVQFFLAGASAVQVGTATLGKFALFNEINLGIFEYLRARGCSHLSDIVGMAHDAGAATWKVGAGMPV